MVPSNFNLEMYDSTYAESRISRGGEQAREFGEGSLILLLFVNKFIGQGSLIAIAWDFLVHALTTCFPQTNFDPSTIKPQL